MRGVNASGLLQAWEDASDRPMLERALRLASVAHDTVPLTDVARWSIRRRDAALFDLRIALFGHLADGLTSCGSCGVPLEMQLDLSQLRPSASADEEAPHHMQAGDLTLTYRLPTSEDLFRIARAADEASAWTMLVACCVTSAERNGSDVPVRTLGADAAEALGMHMARAHADLATTLRLECPACGHAADVPFAIENFLWREVDAWAKRTLHEVHALAREYGWSEPEILALSARRRRAYLELAGRA